MTEMSTFMVVETHSLHITVYYKHTISSGVIVINFNNSHAKTLSIIMTLIHVRWCHIPNIEMINGTLQSHTHFLLVFSVKSCEGETYRL